MTRLLESSMQVASYSLDQFSADAERIVRENLAESDMMRNIKPLLEKLLMSNGVPADAFKTRQDRFAMNLLRMPKDRVFRSWEGCGNPVRRHLFTTILPGR